MVIIKRKQEFGEIKNVLLEIHSTNVFNEKWQDIKDLSISSCKNFGRTFHLLRISRIRQKNDLEK